MSYDSYDPYRRPRQIRPYGPPPPVVPGRPALPYLPAQVYSPSPPQPPAPRKRRWPRILLGVLVVAAVGCAGLFTVVLGGTAEVAGDLDDNQQGRNAVAGQWGRPIVDGKLQFTVTGLRCGLEQVGSELLSDRAQGEFCLVDVVVKNVASTAQTFLESSQKATDATGNVYSVDSDAGISANGESSVFLEQINPGNSVRGQLVFDVPAGTKLTSVVLHESFYTAGVKIPLK
jgi:uncharacterized protein DUF4352